jgi:hypothetical protein
VNDNHLHYFSIHIIGVVGLIQRYKCRLVLNIKQIKLSTQCELKNLSPTSGTMGKISLATLRGEPRDSPG